MSEPPREVYCACGVKLVDELDPPEVLVGGERIPFRRTTDFLACPACRSLYRVTDVGNELVTDGPVVFDPPDPA